MPDQKLSSFVEMYLMPFVYGMILEVCKVLSQKIQEFNRWFLGLSNNVDKWPFEPIDNSAWHVP